MYPQKNPKPSKLFTRVSAAFFAVLITTSPAWAGPGHEHGEATPAAVGQALPRFSAVSETFELVGVLSGKQITLYLDRFTDNSPVRDAQIELEIGGAKFKAVKHGEDEYEVVLPDAPKDGVLPITATVIAGSEIDLLAGELDIHDAAPTEDPAHTHGWTEFAGWGTGAVIALGLLAWGGRRLLSTRSVRAGGAA